MVTSHELFLYLAKNTIKTFIFTFYTTCSVCGNDNNTNIVSKYSFVKTVVNLIVKFVNQIRLDHQWRPWNTETSVSS